MWKGSFWYREMVSRRCLFAILDIHSYQHPSILAKINRP
jgi:hypothetical protein